VATIEEKNILATQILPAIGAGHSRLPLAEVTGFLAMAGHLYQSGLMVVGRAVNGWTAGISPAALLVPANAHTYANTVLESVTGANCPMSWVADCWGAAIGYNTRKSAFWRAIRAVVHGLHIADVLSPQWPSYLVWSNLYKVAPAAGGNPNGTLCSLQLPGCIDLLRLELATYTPTRLLFLTGMNWANPFLSLLGAPVQKNPAFQYVEGFGQATLPGGYQVNFTVASHPQGKPETPWVNEVLLVL
jgi:hypothetical protein